MKMKYLAIVVLLFLSGCASFYNTVEITKHSQVVEHDTKTITVKGGFYDATQ